MNLNKDLHDEKTLEIVLGYECNNKCIFCFSEQISDPSKKITNSKVLSLIHKYSETGYKKIDFNGGEPTINKQLPAFIKYAKKRGFEEICVKSNGLMFAYSEYCDLLCERGLNKVIFSVVGLEDETKKLCLNPAVYPYLQKAIDNLRARNVEIEMNLIISNLMTKKIRETIGQYAEKGISQFNIWIMMTEHLERDKEYLSPDIDSLVPELSECLAFYEKKNVFLRILHLPRCLFHEKFHKHVKSEFEEEVTVETPNERFQVNQDIFSKGIKKESCRDCKYYWRCPGIRKKFENFEVWKNSKPICD